MTSLRRLLLTSTTLLSLTACALTPEFERPAVDAPDTWQSAAIASDTSLQDGDWWKHFGSAELDALIAEAMQSSPTMEAALARIEQARASLRSSRSSLYPDANASGSISRRYTSTEGSDPSHSDSDSLGISIGYELDLFGANRADVESAENAYAAELFDTEATALTLQGDVAEAYFSVVALKERLWAAEENLAAAESILELTRVRYEAGSISKFDLVRQESSVAGTRASVASTRQSLAEAQRALAILVGRTPGAEIVATESLSGLNLPMPDPGQPSTLLARRPDLKSAEAGLRAANADIGVARAAFFPSLDLTASATGSGLVTDPATLVSSLAAGLTQPIFSAGELEAGLDSAKAQYREIAANYRDAVLGAFGETMDALTAVDTSALRAEQLRLASENADEAFDIAQRQFDAGAIDMLELLDAQQSQLDAADALVQAEQNRLSASIALYRALGGSWRVDETITAGN